MAAHCFRRRCSSFRVARQSLDPSNSSIAARCALSASCCCSSTDRSARSASVRRSCCFCVRAARLLSEMRSDATGGTQRCRTGEQRRASEPGCTSAAAATASVTNSCIVMSDAPSRETAETEMAATHLQGVKKDLSASRTGLSHDARPPLTPRTHRHRHRSRRPRGPRRPCRWIPPLSSRRCSTGPRRPGRAGGCVSALARRSRPRRSCAPSPG